MKDKNTKRYKVIKDCEEHPELGNHIHKDNGDIQLVDEDIEYIEETKIDEDLIICKGCGKVKAECNCGRPTKLTKDFLDVAEEIISDDINTIVLTEDELVFMINERLKDKGMNKATITLRTFHNWKKKIKESDNMTKGIENIGDENARRFFQLYKKSLIQQKRNLFKKMRSEDEKSSWHRYGWMLERKFEDWNLKQRFKVDKEDKLIIEVSEDE